MTVETAPRRTEYLPLDHLTPDGANPKDHDLAVIDASIGRFGMIDQIVRDDRTGKIISGHGRHATLTAMRDRGEAPPEGVRVDAGGHWLVPVIVGWASRTDSEARAALIALNRTTELGGWVDDELLALLDDLTAEGDHGLVGVGFDENDIDDLRLRLEDLADDDDNEDARTLAISSDGDRDEDSETSERPAPAAKDIPGVREMVTIHHGDCIEVMRTLADASIDAIVTDPPYGLGFMGKEWDDLPPGKEWAEECLRVLKPGGHLLAFGGSRTWHRLAAAIEDAGFEIRDSIAWLYGSGFPKSLDVSKAIDRELTRELTRELEFTAWMRTTGVTARQLNEATGTLMGGHYLTAKSQPAIPTAELFDLMRHLLPEVPQWIEDEIAEREESKAESRERNADSRFLQTLALDNPRHQATLPGAIDWDGWGTALKPAFEPVVVGRKPLDGTVAGNVLEHGTGALNIDGCRVGDEERQTTRSDGVIVSSNTSMSGPNTGRVPGPVVVGRWPANVVLDDSQAAELDRQSGMTSSKRSERGAGKGPSATFGEWGTLDDTTRGHDDDVGASRFFPTFRYEAKAPTSERPSVDGVAHPTVKPLDLMRWLVRLVTPPGGVVLEPFAGSGTTLEAAVLEGFSCIAIEREADYLPLIRQRLGIEETEAGE